MRPQLARLNLASLNLARLNLARLNLASLNLASLNLASLKVARRSPAPTQGQWMSQPTILLDYRSTRRQQYLRRLSYWMMRYRPSKANGEVVTGSIFQRSRLVLPKNRWRAWSSNQACVWNWWQPNRW